jgi:hypothetical protein
MYEMNNRAFFWQKIAQTRRKQNKGPREELPVQTGKILTMGREKALCEIADYPKNQSCYGPDKGITCDL